MNLKERVTELRRSIVIGEKKPIEIAEYKNSTLTNKVGVVLGCFKWPNLCRLQCRLIRKTCGPVAILISDDCTPGRADDYVRTAREEMAYYWPNATNIGHGGGDLACYWKAPQWAASLGLAYVAKLSQRFLVTRANWLQDSAQELAGSGKALATQHARGAENFELRTEAVMMDVEKWHTPDVLAALRPRRFKQGQSNEATIDAVVRDFFGGEFHRWSLYPENRAERADGVLFRLSADLDEYQSLAAELGVGLDQGFHVEGWQDDLASGTYRY